MSEKNKTPAKIYEFPVNELQQIELAAVHTAGVPMNGSRNSVWLCPAYSDDHEHMLYVKPALTLRQLVAELLLSKVALAMELPCPPSFLVAVKPQHVGMQQGPSILAFGSLQMGGRSTAKVIRNLDVMFEALEKAKAQHGVCVLDEWAANSVRHERDMVFDPRGTIWIIDHESAVPQGVAPDEFITNWLADRLCDRVDDEKRADLLAALRKKTAKPRVMRINGTPPELHRVSGATEQWKQVSDFLGQRMAELDRLLSQRVLPGQMYLPLHTNDQGAKRDTV